MTVGALTKTIATQTDKIASLKANNTHKRKQINDDRADKQATEAALSAHTSALEQEKRPGPTTSPSKPIIW
jgi:predicted  nucleic acid-binding Zn-ribbon protein